MSCGDVEANPGPMHGPSAGGSGGAILQELMKNGMQQAFQLFFVRTPEEGPSAGRAPDLRTPGRNGWWEAQCRCGALLRVRTAGPLVTHAGVCFAFARVGPPTGKLDGGAEGNRAQNGGRGASLLSCGDIEANSGPGRRAG